MMIIDSSSSISAIFYLNTFFRATSCREVEIIYKSSLCIQYQRVRLFKLS